jgi:hypothetical protein
MRANRRRALARLGQAAAVLNKYRASQCYERSPDHAHPPRRRPRMHPIIGHLARRRPRR